MPLNDTAVCTVDLLKFFVDVEKVKFQYNFSTFLD